MLISEVETFHVVDERAVLHVGGWVGDAQPIVHSRLQGTICTRIVLVPAVPLRLYLFFWGLQIFKFKIVESLNFFLGSDDVGIAVELVRTHSVKVRPASLLGV